MRIRHLSVLVFLFASCLVGSFLACRSTASAALAAGTQITNLATFTYSDTTGTFNGQSNTLTITVQNAPVMTITNPGGINVTPAYTGIDTFTLTNTGNNAGTFALTADATFGGTATSTTLKGYVMAGGPGTCTITVPCTLATLNAQTAMAGVAAAGTASIGVEYQVSTAATVGQTVQPTFTSNITYAAGTGTSSGTSTNVTVTTYSDTLIAEARLDVQASAVINTTVSITWTVKANTNGGFAAQGLQSVKTMLGAATNGVAIFMQVPYFAGNTQYQTLTGTPAAVTLSAGVTGISTSATWYYNATPCSSSPTTGWSTTYSASSECLAVFLTNAGATVLPLATGGSTGAGAVGTPQITAIFTTTQPSGTGSGNVGSVNLVASSAIGGDPWMTTASPQPIVGAPLAVGASQDAATASLLSTIESTSTPSSGTTPPGGASNQAQSNAAGAYSVLVGPFGNAAATGNWSTGTFGYTSGGATNMNDFTFVDYDPTPPSINTATNFATFPTGGSIANGGAVTIKGTIQNTGNGVDSITLTNTTNSNWTVAYYCYNTTANLCTGGDSISTCHSTAYASGVVPSVASQATVDFCATFTPSSTVTALAAIPWTITGTSAGTGNPTNTTWDVLYPGGALVGFRTYAVSACPGGVTPANTGVISGCTITYTAYIVNEAPVAAGGSLSVTPTSTVVVSEIGTATWGVNTGGLVLVPNTTNCTLCTFTTITAGSKSFTVTIPIATIAPQAHPSYIYSVVVN